MEHWGLNEGFDLFFCKFSLSACFYNKKDYICNVFHEWRQTYYLRALLILSYSVKFSQNL